MKFDASAHNFINNLFLDIEYLQAQALSAASPAISITGILFFWRVIMGIGIGGDYPLSSIITSVTPIFTCEDDHTM